MSFPFMLMAAQAAGLGVQLYAQKRASRYEKMAVDFEKQELGLRMEQEALQSTERSLFDTEQLRETLASQRAIFAARGGNPGQGSLARVPGASIRAHAADERARSISMGFRKSQIESQMKLLDINRRNNRRERNTSNLLQGLNQFNFNESFGGLFGKKYQKQPTVESLF